jgi:hypothetical protein
MSDAQIIEKLRIVCVGMKEKSTPKERSHALVNIIGTLTGRYDKAHIVGELICDMMLPYMPNDKMIDIYDDQCTEYWMNVKSFFTTL